MKFSDEQINEMRSWMPEMHSISEFQTKLNATFATHLTFLETRFLMDDLNLQLAQPVSTIKKQDVPVTSIPETPLEPSRVSNSVTISVDPVTRPGMVVNGSVTFSDGQKATWHLDQLGRLGLKPEQPDYHPSQEDVAEFQVVLQEKLSEISNRNAFGL